MAKKTTPKPEIKLLLADPNATPLADLEKMQKGDSMAVGEQSPLIKSILNVLNGPEDSIERLAFDTDPSSTHLYQSVYFTKTRLLPDEMLKRIAIQDDLVASIVNARSGQLSQFGRPRPNRFEIGFEIEPKPGVLDKLTPEQKKEIDKRIDEVTEVFRTCGYTKGWSDQEKLTFSQWLFMSTRNAVTVGRIASEVVHTVGADGKKKFHSFRPIDAGTIYKAAPQKQAAQSVRDSARHLIEQIKNKKLEPERFLNDEYAWIQVVEGRPVQAFTSDECLVHNFYPVTDIELSGYPLTPIDTVIAAITTHINITTHNKLYFQSGRATRGMLVIKSDSINEAAMSKIRQQFNANINNVNNSWRMPVFAVPKEDDIAWSSIDSGGKDMEFQYLSDTNARVILSAFQMSPEELPGYAHLSRGTNNQSLAESNKEYQIEAHRDLGIRPLIKNFEDFINQNLFPLIDPNLAKLCTLHLAGLDAETAEKESVRIQQDAPVHGTMDWIQEKVEKKPYGKEWGGEFPFNPQYQQTLDKYFTVGQIKAQFFGDEKAAQDPSLAYYRDEFWFKFQDMQMQKEQMQQQMQMQAQQAQQMQAQGGQPPPDGGGGGQPPQEGGGDEQQQAEAQPSEVEQAVDGLGQMMAKAEHQLPAPSRRILAHQRRTVEHLLEGMKEDARAALKEILDVAEKHGPTE